MGSDLYHVIHTHIRPNATKHKIYLNKIICTLAHASDLQQNVTFKIVKSKIYLREGHNERSEGLFRWTDALVDLCKYSIYLSIDLYSDQNSWIGKISLRNNIFKWEMTIEIKIWNEHWLNESFYWLSTKNET